MGFTASGALSAPESEKLFGRAQESLVGGVDSPVRCFDPSAEPRGSLFAENGVTLWDADGRRILIFACRGALLYSVTRILRRPRRPQCRGPRDELRGRDGVGGPLPKK